MRHREQEVKSQALIKGNIKYEWINQMAAIVDWIKRLIQLYFV